MISVILGSVSSRASHAKDKERTKKDIHAMGIRLPGQIARPVCQTIRLPAAGAQADVGRTMPLHARKGKSNSQTEIPVGPEISLLLA